jgi:hypothetical protein
LYSAGAAAGYQRRAVRELLQEPAFIAAYEEKKRMFAQRGYLETMCPTVEHLRDQLRFQAEITALKAELRQTKQALDDKRRELVDHYRICPKRPKTPAIEAAAE